LPHELLLLPLNRRRLGDTVEAVNPTIASGRYIKEATYSRDKIMIDLPSGVQTFDFDCGAKALQLVMAYYGV
jgi:hypothetical protein